MRERNKTISTQQKALEINLDEGKYGTFVEIGAGQEVARQFFSAGAAAGTVAKTMSAYDMQISDVIYGKTGAYVSKERLEQMLSREFELLNDRLAETRPKNTQFFSYAATVTAKSFQQKSECHGWVGIQVQLYPEAPPSEIVLHVRMLDEDNHSQSEALGILGVNLLYGAFYYKDKPKWIIESLLDNIASKRLEIDLIHFSGPYFSEINNRLMNLHLVRSWCCRAVMFDTDGSSIVPGSALRKKDVMVMRGSYKPPTKVHLDMSNCGVEQFKNIGGLTGRGVLTVAEITMSELASDDEQDDASFLARVDLLVKLGYTVLISDYLRFFRLRSWIRNYTDNRIGIVISAHDFKPIFDEAFYDGLEGGILAAMGKLFSDDTHVYVYPAKINGELVSLDNVKVPEKVRHLLNHLVVNKSLIAIENYKEENLHILARELVKKLPHGRGDWEQCLPEGVAEEIIDKRLFGYRD
ncbi:nicotinate-nucleotide adenylyltransferase [Oceanicoccus sagamiensis]|uniref:Nicotinate-nucleotide adenylyltransferase n=1 Tax=Oceanicoccus sagamiensis TaxID=716816 RepID=A0A1X9N3N9_9GAMM|nr:nicotinate-nucleotide adenylyltransferase [Oceanicoccus sagamiensis]ARN72800.1 nicotinate-nucleotide adenylyltransferase [Oceanicoccus sagamiensis]